VAISILIYLKSLFLVWFWLETSPYLFRIFSRFALVSRLQQQGTLDCLILYAILCYFIETESVNQWIHLIFPPFLILDLLIKDRSIKLHLFFWLEILVLGMLVSFGLNIGFITNPDGGLYFLEQYAYLLSFFWLLFLVSLLNLCNFLDGLLLGIVSVICHTFLFAIFTQPSLNEGAIPFALTLCPACFLFWVFTMLGEKKGLASPVLSSTIAILVGALSVVATSKKVALLSLGMTMGLFIVPILFFAFLIFYTHIQYKFGSKNLADKPQALWRFTTTSVNVFVVLASLCLNFILVCAMIMENLLWFVALCIFACIMFLKLAKRIFIKKRIRYRDIFFTSQDHISLFGIRIFRGHRNRAVEMMRTILASPFTAVHHVVTPDALCLFRATQEPSFKAILQKAYIAIPDGAGVLWTSIFLKERPILERIPGVEFVHDLLNLSHSSNHKVFLLGAREDVLEAAIQKLYERHPQMKLSGHRNGYFSEAEEEDIVSQINQSGAEILLVAMGVPRQEQFIDRNRHLLKVKIVMGIGGSLDVLSGRLRRCPKVIQDYGFEWLYRTIREPWRISRVYALPMYIVTVLKEKLSLGDAQEKEDP